MKKHAWIVLDKENGITLVTDKRKEALGEYEKLSNENKDYVSSYGEFYGDEYVVLAKIEKNLYPVPTDELVEGREDEQFYDWEEYIDIGNGKEVENTLVDVMSAFRPKAKNLKLDKEQQEALIKVANLYERLTGKESFRINSQTN